MTLFKFESYVIQINYFCGFIDNQFQQMTEKTVDQKIKQCKEVIIQNMEKTLQNKMVYMYLKQRKRENEVKHFSVNGKDGFIKIQFVDHDKARNFYEECNFVEKILLRPFNIYFNLTVAENQMKKFYLEGITEENQRKLFEECKKFGVCKLYTSYFSGTRGKLKPNGVLSFIRKEDFSVKEFGELTESLKNLGIKIFNYIHEKGIKCSIHIRNFYEADISKDEIVIQEEAEKSIRDTMKGLIKEQVTNLSIIVKKKQAVPEKNTEAKVYTTALVEFADVEKTMDSYELLRKDFVNKGEMKAILFFHNEQNNSYISLFTSGLKKDKDRKYEEKNGKPMTEKQFEDQLLNDFKKVNKNVIQVNIYRVEFNDTYIGRVYLKTEQDGKDFIVDYPTNRNHFFQNYMDKANITFNINVDTRTLRNIKKAEKKAKETQEKIKRQSEQMRKQAKKSAPYQVPNIMPGGYPGVMPPGNVPNMMMGHNLPPPMMGGVPNMGMSGFTGNKVGIPPPGGMAPMLDPKSRLDKIIKDKGYFETMELEKAKKVLFDPLKYCIENSGTGTSQAESSGLANQILNESDSINSIYKYLESQDELKRRLQH